MEWLQFILALAVGREHAVIVAKASDLSSTETLLLAASWYLALGCLVVYFFDHRWLARKLTRLQDARWCRRLIRAIIPKWRLPAALVLCLVPNGFWLVILLMTFWKYRWYQRVLLAAGGSTISYCTYDAAMSPILQLLGAYVLLAIPALLLAGLLVKQRDKLAAVRHWSLRRYRLAFSKAVS